VRVQHVLADGTFAPGWPAAGVSVSTFYTTDYLFDGHLAPDGHGGVYAAVNSNQYSYVFLQHIAANGQIAPGWPAQGIRPSIALGSFSQYPRVCTDDNGGAYVVWTEDRVGHGIHIYAQHYGGDGVVAAAVSLVSASASAERVHLVWQVAPGVASHPVVERRTESDGWQSLGAPGGGDLDWLSYDDASIVPGTRYAYRLTYSTGGAVNHTPETWVDVPRAARLALAGPRPNPSTGELLQVAFSLPSAEPARLELLDVAGRRVAGREVGSLGAGEHFETLRPDTHLPSGLYWLRLSQGPRALVARAVIAR
jgi:hypothetical protein